MADIPQTVINKLVLFTALMIIAPLSVFFLLSSLGATSVVSGGVAALMANIVLVAFIVVAFKEEVPVDEKKEE